ncbi:mediator of RNA polymerase II transcription subunit 24-like [Dromiciops gliroides]|uniref:mediator of RNA polymerase II transcription subunit 24-like n=1 Tax=Dromiciops gliroides TaxID=33562 RepID=UPI001CC7FA5E|nr:mediator of RNA polymerase II transcription subunit 24-like [Dromiciops gliroides]
MISTSSIPIMLSMHSEQLPKTGFPTVYAVVLLEGTMNLTGEMQPLVEQLMMVKRMQDFTEDVNCAFEFLLKLTPLLDKADHRCNCDCINMLLQECSKQGLLSEENASSLMAKRLNEFTKHISGESSKSGSVRALLFDFSFLMLCHVAQTYGSEVILSESSTVGEVPFFETWMQTCMPEEGKILNPDHPCFRPDSTKVESLVALLNNTSEMKLAQMKWHEACLSISAAILEILNAWENGVLAFESIQKITDNIKGKVCSLAVCAVAWLVAHVRMLGLDEREKSLQMIRQLVGPLCSENTLQFYNEC